MTPRHPKTESSRKMQAQVSRRRLLSGAGLAAATALTPAYAGSQVQADEKRRAPAVVKADLGPLPEWDLSDLYADRSSPEIQRDLTSLEGAAKAFRTRYESRIARLSGAELAAAISSYEHLLEVAARVTSYADLVHAGDLANNEIARFYQTILERTTAISITLQFFVLELNRLSDADLNRMANALLHYRPWLRDLRAGRGHDLSDELEELMAEQAVAGSAGWERLYDETVAELRFPFRGSELTDAEASDLFLDRDATVRREIAATVGEVLARQGRVFTLVTNMLAKDKQIEDRWRRFARPISARNLENLVEDKVVDALIASVRASYPNLSHRYYRLKARWLGVEQLPFWDQSAPLPEEDDRRVPWADAVKTVLAAYRAFSPQMAMIGERFFQSRWIDASARPGKDPGGFTEATVPTLHPYVLLNYQGRLDDVLALAHELGHGIHMMLSAKRGFLQHDPPVTLSETASLFGEALVYRSLLAQETDPKRRKIIIAHQVEDMLGSVTRQIASVDFETRVHEERRDGELSADRICEIWMATARECFGPAVRLDSSYNYYWADVSHFVHEPFYVYAYAYGACLVNALFATYKQAPDGFVEHYLTVLGAGSTLRPRELLAPLGLDPSDPSFWGKGLGTISGLIDELEALHQPP